MTGVLSKSQLCNLYGISEETLRKLLNDTYYEELSEIGYKKNNKTLTPNVLRKFFELYGKPITEEDYEL